MERAAPVRSSHTSTAGLLAWPHPDGAGSLPARRPNQPTEEFRKVVFGGQVTEEGAGGHNKTKMRATGSAPKSKETAGIGIFKAESAAAAVATASRDRQASQITFSQDGTIPPRKPTSVAGVARQRELSHTVESEGDSKMKRQVSSAKSKELSGHDIFADHEVPKPNRSRRSDYGSSATLSPVKNANVSSFSFGEADTDSAVKTAKKKGSSNKSTDLNGKTISGRDSVPAEKQALNRAKPKGMSGSSIFADGKASTTGDHAGRRTRQPPGGDSSILLG
ncbi:hypothetical protein BDA96_01G375800 [Sorghum bicolor]|uniref:DUF4057 domain-containing protein n=2 Tax=Sorghum bicolor TaxID=4558 RepID=A0A921S5J1_SORBI|nr:uncharacterized protein LOC8080467 [Sorghum bicolor]EER94763.1 hypothetical protein SORBI_3001G352500 [Sorghum bicolor]KAG0550882.1 hypothetical protein BDA96_01G375800 [Sorghum bicolor]|eukprot:XP_002467765.1 uncharacterized protein LOC8080467 [Sorghum bicolor]